MKKNIVVCYPFPDDLLARLQSLFTVAYFPAGVTPENTPDFEAALANAEGLVVSPLVKVPVDKALLAKAPALRAVSTVSVGYDHCDVPALTERKILLTHTPGVLTETTADTVFTLILTTARRAVELANMVTEGRWKEPVTDRQLGIDVHHKTIGIVGLGRIGLAVANRAKGFGMSIVYADAFRKPEAEEALGARCLPLDELLAVSDFVCLTLQPTKDSNHLISRDQLARMKPSAVLINTARGSVLDEEALAEALRNKTIHAAGLDVFATEPLPRNSPLLGLKNIVLLPHIGSATGETRYAMMALAVDNLAASLDGALRENCVNKELL